MCRKGIFSLIIMWILLIVFFIPSVVAYEPKYEKGDYWKYDVKDEMDEFDMVGSMSMEVIGFNTITVDTIRYDTTVITFTGDGTFSGASSGVTLSGIWTANGRYYYQESNDEMVKSISDISLEGTATYMGTTYDYYTTMHNESSYYLLIDQKVADIQVGDLGYSKARITSHTTSHLEMAGTTDDSSEDFTFEEEKYYNCVKIETITVPAGTFETYQVRTSKSDGSYYLDWYCEKVGNSVKGEGYDEDGDKIASIDLRAYDFEDQSSNTIFGMDVPIFLGLLSLIILIVIILVVVIASKRQKKKPETIQGVTTSRDTDPATYQQQPQYPRQPPYTPPPPPPPPQ
jgi:hypothetical protein